MQLNSGNASPLVFLVKFNPQQCFPVRVHIAYGRIVLTLELLGRFGQFLDEDDRCNPPVLLIPFSWLLGI